MPIKIPSNEIFVFVYFFSPIARGERKFCVQLKECSMLNAHIHVYVHAHLTNIRNNNIGGVAFTKLNFDRSRTEPKTELDV